MERRKRPASVEFTRTTKKQVYEEQNGCCAVCGAKTHLQYHHIIPASMNGSRERCNCVGVCQEDHRLLDRVALNSGEKGNKVVMLMNVWYLLSKRTT